MEQLERNQEELERNQEELESEKREKEEQVHTKEAELTEVQNQVHAQQQELVRQSQLCFITMIIVLFEYFFLQLFQSKELALAQSANQTQQLELVRDFISAFPH